ncbi:MBL fold metallo-hydrolase [Microtetraspora sp. NBRC 13810]|uniref:MBL fold metallo-hydrolase n=1 Tax=Microtetraspora sp. NBRC 13810 TaxID=3030990 RepID=UPI0024A00BA5|nr:MBL fold metallo-hydrolase [Microtetraspora sp. NBRC 13810]GLW11096.1 MBL fold metallo-hydrolase [Microtetraspora sp. NBRC 13810]
MKVHHLNCGTMRELDPGEASGLRPARALNHCLLVETDSAGLVLVETGFGTGDVERREESLGRTFLERTEAVLDVGETAVRQIERLGYAPEDVRHIVLTHLDLDHSGGLPDFPHATVHLHDAEHRAAMAATSHHPEHVFRYRPAHWAHRPHWATYTTQTGNSWFGFDAIELTGLPPEILLIPLAGHTEGHCAVAVRDGGRWLLHAGDAYYYQGQIAPEARWSVAPLDTLQALAEIDRPLRMGNQARLRELLRDHGDEVAVFSAHDPWEFRRHA